MPEDINRTLGRIEGMLQASLENQRETSDVLKEHIRQDSEQFAKLREYQDRERGAFKVIAIIAGLIGGIITTVIGRISGKFM